MGRPIRRVVYKWRAGECLGPQFFVHGKRDAWVNGQGVDRWLVVHAGARRRREKGENWEVSGSRTPTIRPQCSALGFSLLCFGWQIVECSWLLRCVAVHDKTSDDPVWHRVLFCSSHQIFAVCNIGRSNSSPDDSTKNSPDDSFNDRIDDSIDDRRDDWALLKEMAKVKWTPVSTVKQHYQQRQPFAFSLNQPDWVTTSTLDSY